MAVATRPHLIDRLPKPRGRLTADAPLGPQTWFATGGPAEVLFRPADVEDLATFLSGLPSDVPVTVLGVGSNCHRPRRRRQGRGDPPAAWLHRHRRRRPRGRRRRRCARPQRGADGARAFAGRTGIPERHSRHDRRRVPDQCRRLWRRARRGADRGRGGRSCRQCVHRDAGRARAFLPAQQGAGRLDLHLGAAQGGAGRPARDHATHQRDRYDPRRLPAAQPHRRLDVRQSARPQGMGADRRGRLPWAEDRRRAGLGEARQFPDQLGAATASDIEKLGEEVRRRVFDKSGVRLEWEIRRLGEFQ